MEGRQAWAWMRRGRRISEETAALALPLRWRHSRRWAGAERVCPPQNVAGTQAGTRPLACSRDHACTHTHARTHTHTHSNAHSRAHTHTPTHTRGPGGPGPGLAAIVGPSHGRPLFAALGSETTASRGSLSVMKATEFERLLWA